ncbi:MAG: hypothetical protein KDK70_35695 [Myxococcales bacterium]|nr:hypothetical protein [Myxococcales bacterium]
MKTTILSLALATFAVPAAVLATPSTAHAGDCGSVASVTADIWDEYGSLLSNLPYADKVAKMISFWNKMAGGSWATIGPRRLEYSTNLNGTILGPTDRVFIAETPTDKDSVEIRIEKLDGKAKTSFTVCKVDSAGNKYKLWDVTADNGNYTKTWTKTVSGVKDRIVTVHFHGHSATNKFKYELRATKK